MKYKFRLILFFFIISLYACQSKPEEIILGKWETDKKAMKEKLEEEIAQTAKENPTKAKTTEEGIDALLEKIQLSFEFLADGTMIMVSQANTTKGKWTISADGKALNTTDSANQKTKADILELSKTKMILKFGTDTYHFTRQP